VRANGKADADKNGEGVPYQRWRGGRSSGRSGGARGGGEHRGTSPATSGGALQRNGVASVNFKGFSHFGLESEVGHKFDIRNGLEPSIQFLEQPNRPNSRIHLNSAQFRGAKHALSEF
jgi:hypothetical protein